VKVTAEAARRFLVARHFLAPARSLSGGPEAVLQVLRKFGSIQFDPIAVAGRNHDLMLHARVAGYEPAWCDVLYERREIFEATNKALSFVPTQEFPWFRHVMGRKGPRFHAAALADNAAVAERVLERIRADGPLSSADFEWESGPTKNWFGMPENVVRAVLEAYTVTGVLGLARRDGNLRYYDLLERLLPAELLAHEVPAREQLRHKLLSRYRAHGLLGAGGAGGTFDRIAPPKSTPERVGRNTLREELVELVAEHLDGAVAVDPAHRLGAAEEDEGGHREHREESGGLGIGVDVELRDDRPPVILLGKHVETRGQGFAGRVPGGPEVDHGGNRRLDHACAEGAVSEGQRLRHAGSISREAATSAPCPPGGGR